MIEFGETLRRAREAKGLSVDELAKATHMMTRQVEAMEREDFSGFAAPIYGRGFVKLYCEAVGLDPKPMIAEFMDLFNGRRPPRAIVDMKAPPPPEPAPAPEPESEPAPAPEPEPALEPESEPAPAPEPKPAEPDAFTLESEVVESDAAASAPQTPPQANPFAAMDEEPGILSAKKPSRLAPPQPIDGFRRMRMPRLHIPRRAWRLIALAAGTILILYLLLAGFRALVDAATNVESETTAQKAEAAPAAAENETAAPETKTAPAAPERKRNVKPIAPLYIDR